MHLEQDVQFRRVFNILAVSCPSADIKDAAQGYGLR